MKISNKTAAHFTWGNGCDGWWLLKQDAFSVIEEVMPPNTAEISHYHQNTEQFFYCLEGQLEIDMTASQHKLEPGEGLHIQAGAIHKAKNTSTVPVRFMVISSPYSHSDRVDVE